MRYVSLCDGIGAAHEAWAPLGWVCVARAEIEPFPLAVTAQRQPGPKELGDVSKITEDDIALLGPVDLVVFGSPCQDLSVAGQRKGLAGARSGLFFDCMRVFGWAREHCGSRFALWENVPGAFSSHKGADFALVVGAMAGCDDVAVPAHGWGSEGCAVGDHGMVEWAVLDAQWFGLAQRRKRVFALLDTGDWASRPPILLEREGLRGNSPPRRAQGQGATHAVAERAEGGREDRRGSALAFGGNNTEGPIDVATARNAHGGPHGRLDFESETFVAQLYSIMPQNSGKDYKARPVDVAQPLMAGGPGGGNQGGDVLAFALRGREGGAMPEVQGDQAGALRAASGGSTRSYVAIQAGALRENPDSGPDGIGVQADIAYTLEARAEVQAMSDGYAVRRLTPVECARLQGFADDHCAVTYRKKPAADGPIYKAFGNSMAVPVIRWIGEQIEIALLY